MVSLRGAGPVIDPPSRIETDDRRIMIVTEQRHTRLSGQAGQYSALDWAAMRVPPAMLVAEMVGWSRRLLS
jgi:hypothetical protein